MAYVWWRGCAKDGRKDGIGEGKKEEEKEEEEEEVSLSLSLEQGASRVEACYVVF